VALAAAGGAVIRVSLRSSPSYGTELVGWVERSETHQKRFTTEDTEITEKLDNFLFSVSSAV
jgi:hypothetical protein